MKVALDVSPLHTGHHLQHRVRGSGFYIKNLLDSLHYYYPQNEYATFTQDQPIPSRSDVVHYPYFEPFFITTPLIKKNKTVVTIHDLTPLVFPDNFPSGTRGGIKWGIQKFFLKNIDSIITDSNSSKKDIVKYTNIPDDKITVVYLSSGKEFEKISLSKSKINQLKDKYHLPDEFALYVGDVTWNKNLPNLVKAIVKTDIHFVLVGSALKDENVDTNNPWNKSLVQARELIKNNKKILPLGFVPTEDLVALYNLATVFIMPSFYEGFGLPILEAMACGCPVVTSKRGSIEEVAGEAAYYVNPEDVEDIAKGILEVFSNQKLRGELSEMGIKQKQKFSWEKTADQTIQVYEKTYR